MAMRKNKSTLNISKDNQNKIRSEKLDVLNNLESFWREHGPQILNDYDKIKEWPSEFEDRNITSFEFRKQLKKCSVLVLTANQIEANMMVRLLSENGEKKLLTKVVDKCIYRIGVIDDVNIAYLQPLEMASFTRHGSYRAVKSALKRFHPKLVVSLGVAFGADPINQHLGDVIVSKEIFAYDAKNKRTDGEIELDKNSVYDIDSRLLCYWMNPLSQKKFLGRKDGTFNWYLGTIFSGGTVLSDLEEKERLCRAANLTGYKTIGGEMEGSGVCLSCEEAKIPCVVIKGICDWGALKNGWELALSEDSDYATLAKDNTIKDCVQAMAMHNAFESLKFLLLYNKSVIADKESEGYVYSFKTVIKSLMQKIDILVFCKYSIPLICVFFIMDCANINCKMFPNCIKWILGIFMYLLILFCYKLLSQRFIIRPEKIEMEATNIQLWRLDFDQCICCFQNSDSDSLLDLRVAWLNRKQHYPIRTFYLEKIITQDKVFIDDHKININEETNSFTCKNIICPPIKPDAIQFEYELRGEQICHLIYSVPRKDEKKPTYTEYIFKKIYGNYQRLYKRKFEV